MATVRIGEKDLEVKPATLGFLKHKLIPWRKRLAETTDEVAFLDLIVDGIGLYVGDQVSREWLEEHLPASAHEVLSACAEASGLSRGTPSTAAKAAPGEAASQ